MVFITFFESVEADNIRRLTVPRQKGSRALNLHDESDERPSLTPSERRASLSIAALYSLRMMGLFLVLPVLALHAQELSGATPFLMGLAVGIYGLTQAVFQIPLGALSDRIGRKPIVTAGLIIFCIGSAWAAMAGSAMTLVMARALQGAGAISGTLNAFLADLTRASQRTKAMAIVGVSIGGSFAIALAAGPVLSALVGVNGLFSLTAVMALLGIPLLWSIPTGQTSVEARPAQQRTIGLKQILRDPTLLRLDLGVFMLHMILTASFVAVPLVLAQDLNYPAPQHWRVYLPAVLLGFVTMVPFIMTTSRGHGDRIFLGSIAVLALSLFLMAGGHLEFWVLATALWIFFTAFNLLEASLPALVSRAAPGEAKGMALGVYATTQFLGAFCGGVLGGFLLGHAPPFVVFITLGTLTVVWFGVSWPLLQNASERTAVDPQ
ncbi:MAG: MFS transporter [Pseudomonadota bacterium]|nr:MFS transporter [Pseudomonadota bacterium]